jgi:hypothetical protein
MSIDKKKNRKLSFKNLKKPLKKNKLKSICKQIEN